MTRRLNWLLLGLLILLGLPYYWYLLDNRPGASPPKPVPIEALRKLAASSPGEPPVAIQYETIAHAQRMRNRMAAGTGLRYDRIAFRSFRIDYGARPAVLIDTGMTRQQSRELQLENWHGEAAKRVVAAARKARAIVLLGNGVYHGGLLAPATRTSEYLPAALVAPPEPWSPAPGVAVWPAEEVRKGARIVFVRLADGREYLFAGAVAPTFANWSGLRAPARIDTDYLHTQNRAETYAWLRTIRELKRQAPGLAILSRHGLPKAARFVAGFPSAN